MSSRWTPSQIPDLTGTTAVVTGANVGLGLHTSIELARHGARVVVSRHPLAVVAVPDAPEVSVSGGRVGSWSH